MIESGFIWLSPYNYYFLLRLKDEPLSPRQRRKAPEGVTHDAPWKQEWNEKRRRPKSIEISSPTELNMPSPLTTTPLKPMDENLSLSTISFEI